MKIARSRFARLALAALANIGAVSLAGACSDSSTPLDGGAARSGTSSGSSSDAASGAASGSDSASGSGSGAGIGDAGDAAAVEAGGDDGGAGVDAPAAEAAAPYVPETCRPACMSATGCPSVDCYAASANPVADPANAAVPANLLYPNFAHDGLLYTRYSTGAPAVGVEWFQVDFCRTATVSGVTLDDTNSPLDQAAAYKVQVSLDGTSWTDVAMGSASDAGAPPVLTISFAPAMARYLRVNQTGTLPTSARTNLPHWWSIDEISVSCGTDDGGVASDASAVDSASEAAAPGDASSDATVDAPGQ